MRSVLVLCSTVLLASCGFMPASNETLEESLLGAAEYVNGDGQSLLADFPGRISARAEGDVLIIRFEDLPTGSHIFEEAALRRQLRPLVCDEAENREVIDRGGKFRVEMISNIGTVAPPVTIAHC